MNNFDDLQDFETDSASAVTNTAPKSAIKRGKKASGTTASKRPNKGAAGTTVCPVDRAELDQQLEHCKSKAVESYQFLDRTNDALYMALAKSYVWWRACDQVDSSAASS